MSKTQTWQATAQHFSSVCPTGIALGQRCAARAVLDHLMRRNDPEGADIHRTERRGDFALQFLGRQFRTSEGWPICCIAS